MNKVVLVLLALTAVSGVGVLSWNNFVVDLQPFQIFNSFAEFDDPICTCEDDEGGTFTQLNCNAFDNMPFGDPNDLCTGISGITGYGSPGEIISAQGCGVDFWKNGPLAVPSELDSDYIMWPEGYSPDYYFNDIFHTTISSQPQSFFKVVDVEAAENEDSLNTSEEDEVQDTDAILLDQSEDEIVEEEVEAESISEQEIIQDDETDRGPTLLEALNARGGDMSNLLRHSVAALLNAAHPEINYQYSVVQVLELTQISIINEDYQTTVDLFEQYNENSEKPSICLE